MAKAAKDSPNRAPKQPKLTQKQKELVIERFKRQVRSKEEEFPKLVEQEIKLLRMRFNNRLNKILRKFWDIKLEDILQVEREITDKDKLTLVHVLTQLKQIKKDSS